MLFFSHHTELCDSTSFHVLVVCWSIQSQLISEPQGWFGKFILPFVYLKLRIHKTGKNTEKNGEFVLNKNRAFWTTTTTTKKMGEVSLYVEEFQFQTSYQVSRCRICHEDELETALQLEAPCSCSGTIKVTPKFPFLLPLPNFNWIWIWICLFSSLTETVFRDGAPKKAAQSVKFVSRFAVFFPLFFLIFAFLGFL